MGPTASGKTSLGIFLAQKLKGEIISADSRQVYKGLNIGTGKVTKKEMRGVKHHLLSVVSPNRQFTVDDFVKKASFATDLIYHIDHKIPIVVGGTGLYVDVLLGRMGYAPVPPNQKLREQLERQTTKQLLKQLKQIDPARAKTVEPHNKRRIIRAIEVAKAIGQSPTTSTTSTTNNKYDILWLGLSPTQQKLHKNIHTRLQARIKAGMVAEARRLHKAGLSYKRMDELGLEYRWLARLLKKEVSQAEFEEGLERDIRAYAKRQMRWFKRNRNIHWINSKSQALKLAKKFLAS